MPACVPNYNIIQKGFKHRTRRREFCNEYNIGYAITPPDSNAHAGKQFHQYTRKVIIIIIELEVQYIREL